MGPPLRVLHVTQPTTAGVARVVAQYALACRSSGLTTAVAAPPTGWLPDRLTGLGVPFLPWPAQRSPGAHVVGETRRLRRLLEEWAPDVVHLHSSKAGLAGRWAVRASLPTVFQPHAWSFDAVTGVVGRGARRWERWATRWTHLIVCVGEREAAIGREAGIRGRYRIVANRVAVDEWSGTGRSEARARLGLPPEAPIAVCVGRVCHQKGQDVLVDAWRRVLPNAPGATLHLVGECQDETVVGPGSGVVLTGPADPHPWYAAADVVVLPSRWEGMPLVALEAQASGRVVIATTAAAATDCLAAADDEVAPEDPQALAAALGRRLTDIDATRAAEASIRAAARRRASVRDLPGELADLYQGVVAGGTAPGGTAPGGGGWGRPR